MSFESLASLTWESVIFTFLKFLIPFGSWVNILAPGYMNASRSPCRGKNGAVLIPSIRGRHLLCWQQMWHWAAVKVVKNKLYADFHLSHSFPSSSRGLSPLTLRQCFTFIAQFLDSGWVLSAVWLICAVALLCLVLSALAANMTNWGQTKILRKIPRPCLCFPLAGPILCVVVLKSALNHFFPGWFEFWD